MGSLVECLISTCKALASPWFLWEVNKLGILRFDCTVGLPVVSGAWHHS